VTVRDALASWQPFYLTAGAAAATLVGLLFVGLSLHIRVVVAQRDVRSLARVTLTEFFVVLLVALALLQPTESSAQVGYWLVAISVISGVRDATPLMGCASVDWFDLVNSVAAFERDQGRRPSLTLVELIPII